MLQPERKFNAGGYRFGFNGQEKVDEVSGLGNHNTAEFWEYDTRLGRRWNLDPVTKESESSYSTFSNNPISLIDPNGMDTINFNSTNTTTYFSNNSGDINIPPSTKSEFNINVKQAEGKDVFLWNVTNIINKNKEEQSSTTSTEIKPFELNFSGVTRSPGLFGLYSQPDCDNVTIGKLMISNPDLSEYLKNKNEGYRSLAVLGEQSEFLNRAAIVAGVATITYSVLKPVLASTVEMTGPMKQWIRIGPSYSKDLNQQTSLSIRWGASPVGNGKYLNQIGSSTLRDFNQYLRNKKLPGNNWRVNDPGHFHLRK